MKIAAFTDIHFGEHKNSRAHNEMCIEFLAWALDEAKSERCDTVVFLGDWHHQMTQVATETLNYSKHGLSMLDECGMSVVFILGNHDLLERTSRKIHSLPHIDRFRNITFVHDPLVDGEFLFVPWLTEHDDREKLSEMVSEARYVFGHFEFPGFLMNQTIECRDREGALRADSLLGPDYIFCGHFHKRQMRTIGETTVCYIGNCFPHDFNDAGDRDRGMMILEVGKEPEFRAWPNQPTFDYVPVEEMLSEDFVPEFGSRSKVKLIPNETVSDEDKEELREVLTSMGAGEVTVKQVPKRPVVVDGEWNNEMNIDKMTVTWLQKSPDVPDQYDRDKLEHLYVDARTEG